jgi:hypothetical protein
MVKPVGIGDYPTREPRKAYKLSKGFINSAI